MGTAAWILLVLAEAFPSTCTVVGGNTITAGDISAAVPLFAAIPAATVLSLAPQPGIRRTLTPRELNAWARRFLPGSPGVDRNPIHAVSNWHTTRKCLLDRYNAPRLRQDFQLVMPQQGYPLTDTGNAAASPDDFSAPG